MLGVLLGAAVNFSHFVTATNFSTVLTQVTIVGILAIGQTFVDLDRGNRFVRRRDHGDFVGRSWVALRSSTDCPSS